MRHYLKMDLQRLLLPSLLLWSQSQAEVVDSVSECTDFFLHETPPQIPGVLENGEIKDQNRYKPICQTYADQRRFFTLYDTRNKIPVFSAYIFKGNTPGVYKNQATFNNYKNTLEYDKGHLFPCSYGCSQEDMESTFALTNIVPQAGSFNKGSWQKMESCIKCVMEEYCKDSNDKIKGYLVIGAEPGNNHLNSKINIPSVMWSAFCCYSNREQKWLASAHWANNAVTVHQLQELLHLPIPRLLQRLQILLLLLPPLPQQLLPLLLQQKKKMKEEMMKRQKKDQKLAMGQKVHQ
uniref:Uncharacterized protein n=1 Tax=Periophthalmus magnuspinnatus TaxID=409849 RepID=A0A3B4ALE3_9GOBI